MMTDYLKQNIQRRNLILKRLNSPIHHPLMITPLSHIKLLQLLIMSLIHPMMSHWMQRMKETMTGWMRRRLKVMIEEVHVKIMEEPTTRKHRWTPLSISQDKAAKPDIPVLKACLITQDGKCWMLESALVNIEKLIRSQKKKSKGGIQGLQSYQVQMIESYLRLVVEKGWKGIPASKTAAEGLGFARGWGG